MLVSWPAWGIGCWTRETDQGVDLPFQTGRQEVTLSGVVTAPVEHGPDRMTMIVAVESAQQDAASRQVRGNLRLTWRPCESGNECEPATDVFRGDRITVRARMRAPFGTRNPGGFDYGAYLRDHGIHAVAVVRGPDRIQVQHPAISDFREWVWWQIDRWRNQVRQSAGSTLRQPARGLFLGMIVGEQNDIPPDVRDDFMTTGTVHIIFHIGLAFGIAGLCLIFGREGDNSPHAGPVAGKTLVYPDSQATCRAGHRPHGPVLYVVVRRPRRDRSIAADDPVVSLRGVDRL